MDDLALASKQQLERAVYAQHPEVLCQQDVGPEGVLYPTQQTLQGVMVTVPPSTWLTQGATRMVWEDCSLVPSLYFSRGGKIGPGNIGGSKPLALSASQFT